MGSCLSRSSHQQGQRLGSSSSAPEEVGSGQRGQSGSVAGGDEDRAARAQAAQARAQAAAKRGGGGGSLSKKLEAEQRAGGTGGNTQAAMPERVDVSVNGERQSLSLFDRAMRIQA